MPPSIPLGEFHARVAGIQEKMAARGLSLLVVYGDEYRKENLRYVCNFWPIFERGACFIPAGGEPVFAGAPEGEHYAREMCVWSDIRNVREFLCVTVPDAIDYPLSEFSSFKDILARTNPSKGKVGLVGHWDMPYPIRTRLEEAVGGPLADAADILQETRLLKSPAEIACLREAGRLACLGYEALMKAAVPGATELAATGAAEGAARAAGAEAVTFTVFGSGPRAATIIGRPTRRVIVDGDMVMAALAVQYEGYVSTAEYPFVAGRMSDGQKRFLSALFEAANAQLAFLRDGADAAAMVKAVRAVFAGRGLSKYDVYPPMHGIGLAEAESPYPSEDADYVLRENMCVNSDISLFGCPDGSNRIEEGFLITRSGPESLTPAIRELVARGI